MGKGRKYFMYNKRILPAYPGDVSFDFHAEGKGHAEMAATKIFSGSLCNLREYFNLYNTPILKLSDCGNNYL